MADVWKVTAVQNTDWDLILGESYAHAVTGRNPLTGVEDLVGAVKTLNTLQGLRISGKTFTPDLPGTMTITSVKIVARVWRTAIYAGQYRFFIQLANGLSTLGTATKPTGDSGTDVTSEALAHPGGGAWTRTDLNGAVIGIESFGDGPWDGNEGSGGEIRAKYFRIEVEYTSTSEPVADFEADVTEVFEGGTVNFTDLTLNSPTSWSWDFNGDTVSDSALQDDSFVYATQPAPPPANTYDVTLDATNAQGTDTETKADYIKVWKTTDNCIADFSAAPLSGYAPLEVQFTDLSQVMVNSWDWDFGDMAGTSTDQNPVYTYTTPGLYTVTLDVGNGYTTDNETKVDYIEVLSAIPQFTISGVPTTGPRPLTVQFSFNPTGGLVTASWLWDFGDGTTSVLENPSHTYKTPGLYTVSCTATNEYGYATVTEVDYIEVTPINVVADFEANLTKGIAPFSVRFRDLTTGDASTWNWDFGDANTSTARHPEHTYQLPGLYTVTLVVNNALTPTDTEVKTDYIEVVDEETGGGGLSYLRFLWELQMYMMRPDDKTPCEAFDEYGGINHVLKLIHDRIVRFQLETGTLKKEATLSLDAEATYSLPADLIEVRRVEVDGQRIESLDQQQADRYNSTWEVLDAVGTDYLGYIEEPSTEGLKLTLVPYLNLSPTVKVMYVYAPTEVTKPADNLCGFGTDLWPAFPLPYVFWWIIRFGVEADLLRQEGELYDVVRSSAAEQVWQAGIELVKLLHDSHGEKRG